MKNTTKFYTVMVLVIVGLLGRAVIVSSKYEGQREIAAVASYERLSYKQCRERFFALQNEMAVQPKTGWQFTDVRDRAKELISSARKTMLTASLEEFHANPRDADITRGIPDAVRQWITQYEQFAKTLPSNSYEDVEAEIASERNFKERHPVLVADVPGFKKVLSAWGLFQLVPMLFISVHYALRIRAKGGRVWLEVCGNPLFPFWLLFWQVGIFRYPKKISPMEQLRRARRYAVLVLSSAISCFAGTGKVCESKREQVPQYQPYDRELPSYIRSFAFSTITLPRYVGDQGGIFHSDGVQQSSMTIGLPCGIYFSMWNSEPIGGRGISPNYGREFDYKVGDSFTVHRLWDMSFDLSATYINVSPQDRIPNGDLLQPQVIARRSFAISSTTTIAPYFMLRTAIPVDGKKPVGGTFEFVGSRLAQAIGPAALNIDASMVETPQGAFGYNEAKIGRVTSALDWKLPSGWMFRLPFVSFYDPLTRTNDSRRGPLWTVGVGLTFAFNR